MATTKETQPTKLTAAQLKKKVEIQEEKIKSLKEGAWCYMCDTHKAKDKFYVSTDPMSKSGLTPICKDCAKKIALRTTNGVDQEPTRESVQLALRYLGKPFLEKVWDSSIQEVENLASGKVKSNVWTAYARQIAMPNYIGLTYFDSDHFVKDKTENKSVKELTTEEELIESHAGLDTYDSFLKNKNDVIRLLSYDPFEKEDIADQPFLYSQLLGILDSSEDANEDMMRTSSAISIVRGFLQQSKIDDTVAKLMSDISNIERNSATIKSLQESKGKITSVKDITDSLDMIKYDDQCIQEDIIYVKPGTYAMSSRKIESLVKIAYMQKYYQCNPVRFINDFFNIELLDAQAWIVQQSWTCPNVLLVCSRGFGKSTLIDIIIMSKDMLFNNYWTYIAKPSFFAFARTEHESSFLDGLLKK